MANKKQSQVSEPEAVRVKLINNDKGGVDVVTEDNEWFILSLNRGGTLTRHKYLEEESFSTDSEGRIELEEEK